HQVGSLPPDPCHGILMFHDAAGHELLRGAYDLKPGETRSLRYTLPVRDLDISVRVPIDPCWLPSPGGRAVGSVEVFDSLGKVTHFANPAATRMTDFNDGSKGRPDPGALVGFNPQPDPPAFGMVSLKNQAIRMNVSCFEHPVNGVPPGPCRGTAMFHNAAGDVVKSGRYDLKAGETAALLYDPAAAAGSTVAIIPCVLPEIGGRAVPNVEVIDTATGDTALLINPAADRISDFQRQ
ncbi:MAG TPA: hypothetical protein VLI90_14895, partial [Tepidisphaeraceae bacterium]|nr:hypothetical protein [Tepidisphaeraceae bacterium]